MCSDKRIYLCKDKKDTYSDTEIHINNNNHTYKYMHGYQIHRCYILFSSNYNVNSVKTCTSIFNTIHSHKMFTSEPFTDPNTATSLQFCSCIPFSMLEFHAYLLLSAFSFKFLTYTRNINPNSSFYGDFMYVMLQ